MPIAPIWYPTFDYFEIWQHSLLIMVPYVVLVICFISFYFIRSTIFRVILFLLILSIALYTKRISYLSCPFILLYMLFYYCGFKIKKGFWHHIAFMVLISASIAILFIKIPGIQNWQAVTKWELTPNAIPYSMKFTFDKSLIGLFFIMFSAYTLANSGNWLLTLKEGIKIGSLAILVLIPLSFLLGYITLDLKLGNFFFLWFINNLFFVSLAEEALFRGLIQQYLMHIFENRPYGNWIALLVTANLFGLAHFPGGIKYVFLATIAGLFYGYAFIKTQKIEASVVAHLMVNTAHYLAFTYPALKSAF